MQLDSHSTSWSKSALTLIYVVVITLVSIEVGVRIYFATQIGPRTLLYGTEWHRNAAPSEEQMRRARTAEDQLFQARMSDHVNAEERTDSVELHHNEGVGYTKFFPHEDKTTRDVDSGERIPVAINRHGFRGPDFEIEKQPGVIRVLTLGASSTFGFYDRDNETYPYYLEETLNESCGGDVRFEVINFGVPHSTSNNLKSLLVAEGLRLEPEVVTFYQGRNDSEILPQMSHETLFERVYAVLVHRLMLAAFLDQILVGDRESVTSASNRLGPRMQKITEQYLDNLNYIAEQAAANDFLFVVASQQATSAAPYPRPEAERLPLKGVTYRQEEASIERRMEAGDDITAFEYSFLIHAGMMSALEPWAREQGIAFVDVIRAMDEDRHLLLSWVHLHPDGNRIVAEALAGPILEAKCP